MKKNKEWLKEELMNLYPSHNEMYEHPDYTTVAKVDLINDFIELIYQLDEPEIEENFYTFDNAKKWLQDNGFVVFEKDKLDEEVQRMVDETYEAINEKPVIPKFVADWIDTHNLYGSNPLKVYRDLDIDFNEGWADEKDAAVYHWINKNPYAFIDALRYGYEVEKEKLYRVRAGKRYVRFNLDGSIIGVKKNNSIVCLERLSKLPFDYKKAIESGIITLEEVTE